MNLKLKNNNTSLINRNYLYKLLNGIRPFEIGVAIKFLLQVKRQWFKYGPFKFFIDPCTAFGQCLINFGVYEPEMVQAISTLLEEGDCFIDLGGNEGYFSIIASNCVGRNGSVYCIEPQARLWPVIMQNASENAVSNLTIIPHGISDVTGCADITLYPSLNTGASSLVSTYRSKIYPKQKIRLFTLDEIILQYEMTEVKLMKIDIEGYEINALKSALRSLKNKIIKNIIVEIHPEQLRQLGQSVDELHELLREIGYQYKNYCGINLFSC